MNPMTNNPRTQTGLSMIEVLVTLVILLVGMLGLAGLMVLGQRSEMESYQRVQALILLQDMEERINANRIAAMAPYPAGNCYNISNAAGTNYLGTIASVTPTAATCTPTTIAAAYNLSTSAPYLPPATGTPFPVPITPAQAAINPNVATNPAATAVSDLQAWNYALQGVAEKSGGANSGAMIGARGCIIYDPTTELTALDGVTTIYGSGVYTVSIAWQGLGSTSAPPVNLTCGAGMYQNNQGAVDETLRRVVSLTFRIGTITNTN